MSATSSRGSRSPLPPLLLGAGGALLFLSVFLPFGHEQTHFRVVETQAETLLRILGLGDESDAFEITPPLLLDDEDAAPDDDDAFVEAEPLPDTGESSQIAWAEALYFASMIPALLSPALAGLPFLGLAALGRFRIARFACCLYQPLLFALLAACVGCLHYLNDDPLLHTRLLAGTLIVTALALVETALCWLAFRNDGRGRAVHFVPLILFLLAGTLATITQFNNDQWHVLDYATVAVGSALALVGVRSTAIFAVRAGS